MKILIVGNGYVATRCASSWQDAIHDTTKIHSVADMAALLAHYRPDAVLNAAGVRGKPNVDWCEDHRRETVLGNTLLPLHIAEACQAEGVYLLHIGSGCVFYGDAPHPNHAWREDDHANPSATYSRSKYAADLALSLLPQVGIARIRMPIDSLPGEHNLIDKLARYPKIIDVENSATVIEDMVQVFHALIEKKAEGIFHVTNPGTIRHRDIVLLYQQYVDASLSPEWISNDELVSSGLAKKGRSNNVLASERLSQIGITMRPIREAVEQTMRAYARTQKSESSHTSVSE